MGSDGEVNLVLTGVSDTDDNAVSSRLALAGEPKTQSAEAPATPGTAKSSMIAFRPLAYDEDYFRMPTRTDAMLTYEAAKAVEGSGFTIQAGVGPTLPLTLVEVRLGRCRTPPPGLPQSFSLFLKGTPRMLCPQGTYVLENESLGPLEVFVVPVSDDSETGEFLYQVIFN